MLHFNQSREMLKYIGRSSSVAMKRCVYGRVIYENVKQLPIVSLLTVERAGRELGTIFLYIVAISLHH